jgi:uncharacterized protein (TIGR02757 family)
MTAVPNMRKLARALEDLYSRYNWKRYVNPDPLYFLYDYDDVRDREIVGLIASSLAFGTVGQIMKSIEKVLAPMGESPLDFVMNTRPAVLRRVLEGFRHRWADASDMEFLLGGVASAIERHGSLEDCFLAGFSYDDDDIVPAMTRFSSELVCGGSEAGTCLMPDPCRKSACKRLNLLLRWMVRKDRVDPGGWDRIPASKLVVPLDVHMFRFAALLGFTERKRADLSAAREITAAFRKIFPEDPVKYDFALTRLGIRRDEDRRDLMEKLGIAGGGRKKV